MNHPSVVGNKGITWLHGGLADGDNVDKVLGYLSLPLSPSLSLFLLNPGHIEKTGKPD